MTSISYLEILTGGTLHIDSHHAWSAVSLLNDNSNNNDDDDNNNNNNNNNNSAFFSPRTYPLAARGASHRLKIK